MDYTEQDGVGLNWPGRETGMLYWVNCVKLDRITEEQIGKQKLFCEWRKKAFGYG